MIPRFGGNIYIKKFEASIHFHLELNPRQVDLKDDIFNLGISGNTILFIQLASDFLTHREEGCDTQPHAKDKLWDVCTNNWNGGIIVGCMQI